MEKSKNNRFLFPLLFLVTVLGSCNKLLDVKEGEYILSTGSFYKTEEQLNTAIRGVYASLADAAVYGNNMLGRFGLEADEGYYEWVNDRGTVAYYETSSADAKILNHWRSLYQGISRANFLLANIGRPDIEVDSMARAHFKGQALFLRGYYYLMLVSKFGGVPLLTEPSLTSDADAIQLQKASVKEVYDQILKDMTEAADLVQDVSTVQGGGTVSKSAVWGMLARVCLYMAGEPLKETARYADAAVWAGKVITHGHHALNPSYSQVFINYAQDKYDTKESILEVEFWGNGTGVYINTGGYVGILNGIRYGSAGLAGFGYSLGSLHPTQWLYDIYEANDVRRDWAIAPFRYVNDAPQNWTNPATAMERFCGKFRRENEQLTPKSNSSTPQNFPLLRYSDVLLMYAEALNESIGSPTAEALEAINKVRRRAVGADANTANPSVDLEGIGYDDLKQEIIRERAKELCFEELRKNDLVRWGIFYSSMKDRLMDIPATGSAAYLQAARVYYGSVTPRDVIWPLPAYELGVNPKLTQNQGW